MMKPMSIDVSSDSESVSKCCYRPRKTHAHPTEQRRVWEVEEERKKTEIKQNRTNYKMNEVKTNETNR